MSAMSFTPDESIPEMEPAAAPTSATRNLLAPLALITALVFVVGLAGLGVGDTGGDKVAVNAALVPAAADAAAKAGSSKFIMQVQGDVKQAGATTSIKLEADGAYDYANRRGELVQHLSNVGGQETKAIVDGDTVYLGGPALAAKLPAGKSYVRVTNSHAGMPGSNPDPLNFMATLKQISGPVTQVGKE